MVMIINPYIGNISGNIQIGFGVGNATSSPNNDTDYPSKFFYNYSVSGLIFTPAELSLVSGRSIYKIEFQMFNQNPILYSMSKQDLSLGHTTQTVFNSNTQANLANMSKTGFTKVKSSFTWTIPASFNGWMGVDFSENPFSYDGTKSLIIHWLNSDGSYITGTSSTPYCFKLGLTGTQPTNAMYWYQDGSVPITTEIVTLDQTGRPNIRIYWV